MGGPRQAAAGAGATLARWTALPLVLGCLASSAAGVAAQAPSGSAWPQFRGNPRLTGVADSAPPAALKLLWRYEVGDAIDSSPSVADGVVYVGSFSGDLVAVDLASGAERWRYAAGNVIGESSPAVVGETVFIGDGAGVLHAVGARDGRLRWMFQTGQEIKSSPVVAGGLVLVGSYDGFLYALDAASGKLHWRFETNGPVHATPAVRDGTVFVAGCDESFRAVRLEDGQELYAIPAGANTAASPVLDGDRAYVGTFNNEVLGFDLAARKIIWRYQSADRPFPYYSSAALAGALVIVGSRDKLVHAIDAATGKVSWTFATRARVDSSPAVAGGRVYVGSSDGRLYVLDAATGNKLWEFDAGSALTASPAIAGGRVVIGSVDGVLYCFG